jgi:hypothetical protein
VLELFTTVRLTQDDDSGEPGDTDLANRRFPEELDKEEDQEYEPKRRYRYSREHKLAAIDYFQTTWTVNKDSTH